MKTAEEQFAELGKPFDWDEVEVRPQGKVYNGKALCIPYIRASAARARLNRIFKPWCWQVEYRELNGPILKDDIPGSMLCRLTVTTADGHTVVREGIAGYTDIESAKGGESDSFKRAFAALGNDTLQKAALGYQECKTNERGSFTGWKAEGAIQRAYLQAMADDGNPPVAERTKQVETTGFDDPFQGQKPSMQSETPQKPAQSQPDYAKPFEWKAYAKECQLLASEAKEYQEWCLANKVSWMNTAKKAQAQGIKSFDELMKFAKEQK